MHSKQGILIFGVFALGVLVLINPLKSADPANRLTSADLEGDLVAAMGVSLEGIGDPHEVATRLGDAPIRDARRALMALARLKPEGYTDVFRRLLANEFDAQLREAALVAWSMAGNIDAELFTDLFARDGERIVRARAATALADHRQWRSTPVLVNGLRDSDPTIRHAAHEATVRLLGFRLPYHPKDKPAKREKAVRQYARLLSHMEQYQQLHTRLIESEKEKSG